jgi:hypothetical protein
MSTFGTLLIVWGAVLAVLVAALALGTRRRSGDSDVQLPDIRGGTVERRRGGDRRTGMPDRRENKVERRLGARDRRRVLGPA